MMLDRPSPQTVLPPLLTMQEVRKTYRNGVLALDGITLTLPGEPQFIAVIGPSGCGKSTLLKLAAGLEAATAGGVGWPAFDRAGGERAPGTNLGYVFQEPTLMPWATVFENAALPLRIRRIKDSAVSDRVMQVLESVGLQEFARSYPRELSGGMRMRASVARALVTEPRLLLMDEPFAALDEITRAKIERDLIGLWLSSELSVVFVTHSVFEAVFLASRVVVMTPRPGRITADLKIRAPYPRTEEFRTSAAYIEQCRQVSGALAQAMNGQSS
jgi:NitT/TauT family transport system ATP-binding protein